MSNDVVERLKSCIALTNDMGIDIFTSVPVELAEEIIALIGSLKDDFNKLNNRLGETRTLCFERPRTSDSDDAFTFEQREAF
jgi:hypothetical protein